MSGNDDELDQRFRDLIRAEFGDVAGTRSPGEADPPPLAPPPVRRFGVRKLKDPIEYFNLSQAIEAATPDEDFERWSPPVDASIHPSRRVWVGIGVLVVTLIGGVVLSINHAPGVVTTVVVLLGTGSGLALLLSSLPRRRHLDGDGAQL